MSGTPEDAAEMAGKGASGFIIASDQGFLRQGARTTRQVFGAALDKV
jgi:hypothetical protein